MLDKPSGRDYALSQSITKRTEGLSGTMTLCPMLVRRLQPVPIKKILDKKNPQDLPGD